MSIAFLSTVALASIEIALAAPVTADKDMVTAAPTPVAIEQAVEVSDGPQAPLSDQAGAGVLQKLTNPFADKTDEEVVAAVFERLEGIKVLRANFVQIPPSGEVSAGKLYIRRPGQLRLEYDPATRYAVATQGMVYWRNDEVDQTDSYPLKQTPLRYLLSKRLELGDAEVVSVVRGEEDVAITFASDDVETEGRMTLILNAFDLSLERWIAHDLQDRATVVTLQNVVEGGKLSNRLFRVPDAGGDFLKN